MDSNNFLASLRPLAFECGSEFVGTFVLVFLGTASIAISAFTSPASVNFLAIEHVAVGWGFAAMLATFIASPGSGAHLNPAVTLAIALSPHTSKRFPKHKVPVYMLFQVLGATFAGLAVYLMFGSAIARFENRLHLVRGGASSSLSAVAFGASFPHPLLAYATGESNSAFWSKDDISVTSALLLEALATLVFALVQRLLRHPIQSSGVAAFTNLTTEAQGHEEEASSRMPATPLAPLYVGAAMAALTMAMTPFTQACLNPARDFGPRVVAAMAGWGSVAFPGERANSCWVYVIGPMLGAVTGSMLFDLVIVPGLQTRDEAAVAWMRRQQMEGDALLEQLEKSRTMLHGVGAFEALGTRRRHYGDLRDSCTHNFRLSSPTQLYTVPASCFAFRDTFV